MFEKIRKGLKNFTHNLLNITHSLFGTSLVVGGIVACAFYAFPILPVVFYAICSAIIGSLLFGAAHKVVDFFANMFNKDAAEVTPRAVTVVAKTTHEHTASSTNKINSAFEKTPAAKKDAAVQTQTENKAQKFPIKSRPATAVASNEEQASPKAVSFSM